MKIAITFGFFLPVPPVSGGAMEKIFFNIGRRLADRGHDVSAFTRTWQDWPRQEVIDGVKYHRIPGWNHTPHLWRNLILDFRWGLRVRRQLPLDAIVVANNVSLPIQLRRGFSPHPSPVSVVLGRMPKGQIRFYQGVDRIYATSEAVAVRARYENQALSNRVHVLRNSIDWQAHQGPSKTPSGRIRIGFAGRIHPEKGLDFLMKAAAILELDKTLPAWEITLVGPVETAAGGGGIGYRDSLIAMAEANGAGHRIKFFPPAWDPQILAEHYRGFAIFCYPSRAEKGEGLSVAPIEAMSAGAVPVLSTLGCYDDLIVSGQNGILFNHRAPDSPVKLAHALAQLLRDPANRNSLSDRARATAKNFDYDALAVELETDLSKLRSG
jgi:glycosyltransferase involved in cell wall biosynthesis